MKATFALFGFVGLTMAFSVAFLVGDDKTSLLGHSEDQQLPGLMLAKLASTQRIVAGLVSKDFSEIKRGALDMRRICDAAQWETHPDPIYGHHRTELRRQTIKLERLAADENLDGAAFMYMQTMSTCISCHEHCRDVLRIAELPKPMPRVVELPAADAELGMSAMPILRR